MTLTGSLLAAAAPGEAWWQIDMTPETMTQILQIIWIDLILSGDNAVVIALACRALPADQRRAGIFLGASVAILLRIAFAGIVTQLLNIPLLKLIGGLLLFWIAVKLIIGEDEDDPNITSHDRLWRAVMTIALADVLMSLDNVIAIAAVAKGSVALIAFGVLLSIPLIIFGSTFILGIMRRFPLVVWFGGALLGWIAGELIASEMTIEPYVVGVTSALGMTLHQGHYAAAALGAVLAVLLAMFFRRGKRQESAIH